MLNFAYKKPLSVLFSITLEGTLSILDGKFMGKHFTKERSSVVASKRTNEIIYICQMPACEWTQGLLCLTLQSWEGAAEGLKHIRMHSILMKWPQSHSITSQRYPGMDRSSTNTPEPENSNGTPVARSKAPHSHGQAPFFSFLCWVRQQRLGVWARQVPVLCCVFTAASEFGLFFSLLACWLHHFFLTHCIMERLAIKSWMYFS